MMHTDGQAAGSPLRRLFVYNGGFLTQRRTRRILQLAGYQIRLGRPSADDMVGIWGHSPTANRGIKVAHHHGAELLRIEDAFLRSVLPGRAGGVPLGLMLDPHGVHFDAATPSALEQILTNHPLDDTALLNRARAAIARLRALHLSKYTAFDPGLPAPDPGYVLVVDQTRGDASVRASGATPDSFREMLACAQIENPGARILIKPHPETLSGGRAGHFDPATLPAGVEVLGNALSPWHLLEGAIGVYTVSSQLGFEAILAGHRPRVFGHPFYAGWGLTQDEHPIARRTRRLTRAQLTAGALILAPTWYDPYRDQLCELEQAIDALAAQTRAWREDHQGWQASHIRLWKRPHMQRFFGQTRPVRFAKSPTENGHRDMIWATQAPPDSTTTRVEDGFLRSRGLGAELIPPLSLVCDDLGIHYDPSRESRLERLIAASGQLRPDQLYRAERLMGRICALDLSKYNQGGALPALPDGARILVPGQVEDDASVLQGCGKIRTNRDLLQACRAENPDAVILYKPHPDVLAGLRPGTVEDANQFADVVLGDVAAPAALWAVEEIWTLTSLMGFEALMRGRRVTCLGIPFYAGWGLTRDQLPAPARRRARPTLLGLVHAALIAYPRYYDPLTRQPCPPEVAIERLASGTGLPRPPMLRLLAKAQGIMAGFAPPWQR